MTTDRDRLATLLHARCEADWKERFAHGASAITMHSVDAHNDLAAYLLAAGVTLTPPATADLRAALRNARLYVMGLPAARCGEPIHIPSFEALAALDMIADALDAAQPAPHDAVCACPQRPWCAPHGWSGTSLAEHGYICADHGHVDPKPAPEPGSDEAFVAELRADGEHELADDVERVLARHGVDTSLYDRRAAQPAPEPGIDVERLARAIIRYLATDGSCGMYDAMTLLPTREVLLGIVTLAAVNAEGERILAEYRKPEADR